MLIIILSNYQYCPLPLIETAEPNPIANPNPNPIVMTRPQFHALKAKKYAEHNQIMPTRLR